MTGFGNDNKIANNCSNLKKKNSYLKKKNSLIFMNIKESPV